MAWNKQFSRAIALVAAISTGASAQSGPPNPLPDDFRGRIEYSGGYSGRWANRYVDDSLTVAVVYNGTLAHFEASSHSGLKKNPISGSRHGDYCEFRNRTTYIRARCTGDEFDGDMQTENLLGDPVDLRIRASRTRFVDYAAQERAQSASKSCYGCNVMDDGTANDRWFSATFTGHCGDMYFRKDFKVVKVECIGIDLPAQRIRWRLPTGQEGWSDARYFYSKERSDERDAMIGIGAFLLVVGAVAVAVLTSGSSSHSTSSPDNSASSEVCRQRCNIGDNSGQGQMVRQRCERQC